MKKIVENGHPRGWPTKIVIHTDGASRGNPGPAAIGLVVYDTNGDLLYEYGEDIGENTNNYAEYSAVLKALELAKQNRVSHLILKSDSLLVVR